MPQEELQERIAHIEAMLEQALNRVAELEAAVEEERQRADQERQRADQAETDLQQAREATVRRYAEFLRQTRKLSCGSYFYLHYRP